MATHKKTIDRDGPSMKGAARDAEADERGVIGAEHKVPLSEAVLKAVGLHGGTTVEPGTRGRGKSTVRDLRDQKGAIFLPAPDADECDTVADVVAHLSAKHKGYFERTPVRDAEGQPLVTVRFTYGEAADIVTGSGKTTRDAVKAMAAKLGESFDCLDTLEGQ